MNIRNQILEDIKAAMKAKDNFKRDTLRTLNSSLKQVEIDERIELSDERVISILQTQIKRRNDSAEQYLSGGRQDLAQKEKDEIKIISGYLPKQLNDEELKLEVLNIIKDINATSSKDMGLVMKTAKEKIGGRCDGKRLSQCVKKFLS